MNAPPTENASPPSAGKSFSSPVRVLLVVLFLVVAWQAREVLLLLFAGLLLALFLSRLTDIVRSHTPFSRGGSYAAVLLLLAGSTAVAVWLAAPRISQQMDELAETLPQAVDSISLRVQEHRWARELLEQAPDREQLRDAGPQVLRRAGSVLSSTAGMIGAVVIVLAIGLYLAAQLDLYRRGFLRLVPVHRRARAGEVLDETLEVLGSWLEAQLVSMAIIGLLTTLGLWWLGVPLALTLGLLAALLELIPNFGPILSAIPAVLLSLMVSPTLALWVVLLYVGLQAVESYLVTPLVQRRMVSLPPVLVIVSQIFFAALFGFPGLALATPLLAGSLVLVKRLYVEDRLGDSLGEAVTA